VTFAQLVEDHRLKKSKTVGQLCKEADIQRSHYYKIMHGQNCTMNTVTKVCTVLGIESLKISDLSS